MNKFYAFIITSIYSIVVVLALFTGKYICPKMDSYYFRPLSICVMAIFSFILMYFFDLLGYFYLFHSYFLSKCAIRATVVLFLGAILQSIFDNFDEWNDLQSFKKYLKRLKKKLLSFEMVRSLIIGPLTEEMIYRSFACSLWEDSGIPNGYTIFLLSFIFGVSHMNKYFLEKGPLGMYIIQVGFTTVFGWWESFVWLKTNSYFTCVFLHSFCNYMQFPDFKEAFNWPNKTQRLILVLAYSFGLIFFVASVIFLARA